MTVQVSVTVWTILCFLALMLILDRLLFRPLLSFMDKRQGKVTAAREAKESSLRQREEALRQQEEDTAAAEKKAAQEAAAAVEAARAAGVAAAAEKKTDSARRLEEQRAALEQESQAIQSSILPRMEELAAVFAQRLQSWQDQEDAAPPAEPSALNNASAGTTGETI